MNDCLRQRAWEKTVDLGQAHCSAQGCTPTLRMRAPPKSPNPLRAGSTPAARNWYRLSEHGTSRLPLCPGWGGTRHQCSQPLPFGFRAKSQSCLCCRHLCYSFGDACPHHPSPGAGAGLPGHLTARRCPQAVGAAGGRELRGMAWRWGWRGCFPSG